jgi:hypothetical protein
MMHMNTEMSVLPTFSSWRDQFLPPLVTATLIQLPRFSYGMLSVVIAIVLQANSSCIPNDFVRTHWNRHHRVAWR